jgi:muramoyltetrapeptide carboxypeptidase LdcA involved in peptidoglycan recycling
VIYKPVITTIFILKLIMPASSLLDKTGVLKTLPKFKLIMNPKSYRMAHPIYKKTDIETIKKYHHEPEGWKDRLALAMVRTVRGGFDMVSRYNPETMNERDWLNRIVFLETVAGVPGMIGGMVRHLKSLRTLEKDHGWIHHLLQEAENERMHLFIFLTMRNPGVFFRVGIASS